MRDRRGQREVHRRGIEKLYDKSMMKVEVIVKRSEHVLILEKALI